jgi:hypothetical protein
MSRLIAIALRAVPPVDRRQNGAAIEGLSQELIEGGDSSVLKEARGIAGYGLRKRVRLNIDWLRALPWADALWLLALPIASVQTAMLVLSGPFVDRNAIAHTWPGLWFAAAGIASLVAIAGAALRRRSVLALGALALSALLIYDEYWQGGGMVRGSSHTQDFSFAPLVHNSILGPVALVLIPTTLFLVATAAVRPPRHRMSWLTIAWSVLPFAAVLLLRHQQTTNEPQLSYSMLGLFALFCGIAALSVRSVLGDRAEYGLAAGLLLALQTPLLGLQLAFSALNVGVVGPFPVGVALPILLAILLLPLAAAAAIVRTTAGPGRLG